MRERMWGTGMRIRCGSNAYPAICKKKPGDFEEKIEISKKKPGDIKEKMSGNLTYGNFTLYCSIFLLLI